MKKIISITFAALMLTACNTRVNPFLTEWDTPYGIPDFGAIQTDDYIPAIEEGIRQQNDEILAITSNAEAPTFDNTILPLELSGRILARVQGVLFNIVETDRTDALDSLVEMALPLLTAHASDISFNQELYKRVAAIYEGDQSDLTREQQMVLKKYYENFQHNGVALSVEDQATLRDINTKISVISQKLGNNLLDESNRFKEEFGFSVSDYPNAMTTTSDRALRQRMLEAYTTRGHHDGESDNRDLFLQLIDLRIQKAQILGYDTPAAYVLSDKMAKDPATVDAFLASIMDRAVARAKEEVRDMQAIMDQDIRDGLLPAGTTIQPWDWWYYAERVRKAKYDLDESLTKPYFSLDNVVKGAFLAAQQLYGVHMERIDGVPAYNTDCVTTFKVTDDEGNLLGIFTTDWLPRDSKRGGAWMNNVRDQLVQADGTEQRPIIVNVGNLEEYLTVDEVQTVFHEFGHALHGLLTQCHYPSVSGTSVLRDFVETFSQFNENWAFQPELLAQYAINAEGEVIPDSLVQKINATAQFNQGFMTTELCAASILDMKWHELTTVEGVDLDAFEQQVCTAMGLIPEIGPRYRTTYFNHIFSDGYAAGYYSYLWAEVLDKDAFSIFEQSGNVWNAELAQRFKETFLQRGGGEEPMTLFRTFAGREPDNTAFLRGRGL